MKRKLNILLLTFVLLLTTACSSQGSKKDKITIWAWDPNFNIKAMEKAKKYYEKTNPDAEIEIVEFSKSDVEQKLTSALLSNSKSELPDIVLIEDYNAQKYLNSYPGAFANLTDEIDYSDFVDYKVELMTLNNNIYGVPFDSGVAALFYRHDILEEAGYTAKDLENITWSKYIEIGKDVKEKTGKTLLAHNPQDTGLLRIMLQSAGSWFTDANGELNLTGNDVMVESLNTLKELKEAGIITEAVDWSSWITPTSNGTSASTPTGIWIMGTVKSSLDQSGLWSIAPIPRLENSSSVNASNLGGSSWYVLDSSDQKEQAIDFLKNVYAGDVDFYQEILTDIGAVGSYIPAFGGTAYQYADPFFNGQKVMDDVTQWMEKIPPVAYGSYTYEISDAITAQLTDFYSGKIDVHKLLENVTKQVSSSMK